MHHNIINQPGVILRLKDSLNPFEQSLMGRDVVRKALSQGRRVAYFSLADMPGMYETEELWTEYVIRTGRNIGLRQFEFEMPECNQDELAVRGRLSATNQQGEPCLCVVEGKIGTETYSIVEDVSAKAQQGFNLMVILGDGLTENYHLADFRKIAHRYGVTIIIFD